MGGRAAAVMIGRVPERDRIVEALADGAHGQPRAVIVRGEAGIGKTRLVTEALTVARPPGSVPRVIAVGQCVDLGAIGAPFIPIRRLLRDLHDGVGDEVFRAAAGGPAVLATLARLMPQLADAGTAGPGASGDEYVAEAIEHVIEALSVNQHLVLLIEDLHWADSASVALVQNLARTLRGSHLTIIMTVRNGEVGRRNPLREALVEMDRNRSLVTIDVPRLSPEEATQQARAIVGDSLDAHHVATLAARSDGVPFFVEELVQVASEDLPPTLREVTMVRVDRLSEPARGVVRLAAVGGIEVPSSVLDEVWRGGPDELAAAIREAVEADVLVPRGSRYTFRHALIREAVYEDLVPTEAAAIHRRYAELLQSRLDAGEGELAALASEHWLATHDSSKAFDATALAREVATQASAIESAAELGERLLTLWQAIPDAERRLGVSEAALRMAIALEYRTVHRVRACLRVIDDALATADPDDAAIRIPLELVYLSVSTQTERTVDDPLHLAEIERLLATYDGPDAAILRARAAATACAYAPEDERPELAERALALAEATGDVPTQMQALRRRSRVSLDMGLFEKALADLTVAQALTEPLSDDHWWIVNNTVCMYISLGQYEESIKYGKRHVDAAIAAGLERAAGPTLSNLAEAYIGAGQLDAGLAAARRARTLERADSPQFTMNSLQIESVGHTWAGDLDDAEAALRSESVQRESLDHNDYWRQLWGVASLDVAVARARDAKPAEAVPILDGAQEWLSHLSTRGHVHCELDESFVSASAWLAAIGRAGGHIPEDILGGVRMVVADFPDEVWWHTPKAIARGYLARVDKAEETSLWRAAVAEAEIGRCLKRYLWLSRYELATALVANGERAEGIALLAMVAREASTDGIALVARWAREDLAAGASPERASGGPLGQLTPREREVLALVAEGLTNGEIGKRLFISSKTASVHVSAILAKLGAANRAEAASVFAGSRN